MRDTWNTARIKVTVEFWKLERNSNVTMTVEKTKAPNIDRSLENGDLASMINLQFLEYTSNSKFSN